MVYTWLKPTTQDANMPPPDQPNASEKKSLSDLFALADKYIAPNEGMGMSQLAKAADFVINDSGTKYNESAFQAAVEGLKTKLEGLIQDSENRQAFQDIQNNLDMTITAKDRLTGIDRMLDMILSPTDRKDQRLKYETAYKTLFPGEEDVLKEKGNSGSNAIESYNPTGFVGDSTLGFNESGMCGKGGYITNMITMLNKESAGWESNPDNRKLFQKIVLKSQAMGFNPMNIPNLSESLKTIVSECTKSMQTEATPEQQIQLCEQVLTSLEQNAPDHVKSLIQQEGLKGLRGRAKEDPQGLSARDILTLQEQTSIAVYNTLNQNKNWQLPSSRGISSQKRDTDNHSTKLDVHNQGATPHAGAGDKSLNMLEVVQYTLQEKTPEDSIFAIFGQSQQVIDYNKKLSQQNTSLHDYLKSQKIILDQPTVRERVSQAIGSISSKKRRPSLGEMAVKDVICHQTNNLNKRRNSM